jgi:GTP cyclohydrolase I
MSYNKTKCDPQLGLAVHEYLVSCGVETPTIDTKTLDRKVKIEEIEKHFASIMHILGLDLRDDSLNETPKRVAKMYVNEIFYGLDYEAFPKCTTVATRWNTMKW